MKNLTIKRPSKNEREKKVLLGLVDLYLSTGKPIGSNTLRENGFQDLSSATIRNYFAKLEEEGFLEQPHSSGGRIPTSKAYKNYADFIANEPFEKSDLTLEGVFKKEVTEFLHIAAETLSDLTNCSVFLSTPIFEMDFIQTLRLIPLENQKILCVLITDFGLIRTETLYLPENFTEDELALIQKYFYWRMSKGEKPLIEDEKIVKWAQRLYSELMMRHVVDASSVHQSLFKTGLSKLLNYPEFNFAANLANGLAIFENPEDMQKLLRHAMQKNDLTYFIGDELARKVAGANGCSVILMPYYINQSIAGAFAILGPTRIPYKELFQTMRTFSEELSETLTQNVYKFKISFKSFDDLKTEKTLDLTSSILLEDKSS